MSTGNKISEKMKSIANINSLVDKKTIDDIFIFYNSRGYLYRNSGAVGITIVLLIVFFLINSYLFININNAFYKKNWTQYRCDPAIIPFAGIINAPSDENTMEYTFKNFSYCMNKILDDIVSFIMSPVIYVISVITAVYKAIEIMIIEIVRMFDYLRTAIMAIVSAVLGVVMNFLIPFQKLIIKLKVIYKKVHATTVTSMYTFFGTYMAMMSGVLIAYEVVIMFAFILAGIIIVLWIVWLAFLGLNPVPAVIASAMTVILVVILALIIKAAVFSEKLLAPNTPPSIPGVPSKPACFGGDSPIKVKNKGIIEMCDIEPGMILDDPEKSLVTAVFKLNSKNQKVYKIYDSVTKKYIYATCKHRILNKNINKWVPIEKHPDAISVVYNEPYLYCLNTNSKTIIIGEHKFKDWDDMYKNEYPLLESKLRKNSRQYKSMENGFVNPNTLYTLFENGFHESTMISLKNKESKSIKKIKVGDVLENNGVVWGVVKILNSFTTKQYDENINCTEKCFVKSKNNTAVPIFLNNQKNQMNLMNLKNHKYQKNQKNQKNQQIIYGIF